MKSVKIAGYCLLAAGLLVRLFGLANNAAGPIMMVVGGLLTAALAVSEAGKAKR